VWLGVDKNVTDSQPATNIMAKESGRNIFAFPAIAIVASFIQLLIISTELIRKLSLI